LIGLLLVFAYAVLVEPFWLRTKVVEITDANFVDFFKQYKTVLISDIHVSRLGIREKILLNKIKKISPDIIFITGDLVSWAGDYEKAFELISKLKSKVGIWTVMGDSDYQSSRKACIFCHSYRFKKKPFAVKFLRNQTDFLPVGQSRIAISGIELNEKDAAGYESILMGNRGHPKILLSHNQFDLGRAGRRGERRKEAGRRGGWEKIEDGKLRRWEDQKGHKAQGAGFRALGKMGSGSLNSAETIDSDTAKAILRIPELGG